MHPRFGAEIRPVIPTSLAHKVGLHDVAFDVQNILNDTAIIFAEGFRSC